MCPTSERSVAFVALTAAIVFLAGIVATEDGLIGWKEWFVSPPAPENEHERVVKRWADHLAEPERKWEWYLSGAYSNDAFVHLISNHLEDQHGVEPLARPEPLNDETFHTFMLDALEMHPIDHEHE